MQNVYDYLKACGTFYLATVEENVPRNRPFGAVCVFEDKLYIVTNNKKPVFQQMKVNPRIEISGMSKGTWIRVEADVVQDARREARVAMLDAYPNLLTKMYNADDNLMEVFYLENATATVYSYTDAPVVTTF